MTPCDDGMPNESKEKIFACPLYVKRENGEVQAESSSSLSVTHDNKNTGLCCICSNPYTTAVWLVTILRLAQLQTS